MKRNKEQKEVSIVGIELRKKKKKAKLKEMTNTVGNT